MLALDKYGRPQLNATHLFGDVPKTYQEVIDRYSGFEGRLFHHIVSSPQCNYEKRFGKGRIPVATAHLSARERFQNILKSRHIIGNPKSFFVNKNKSTLTPAQIDAIKSVSFALASHSEVAKHFQARDSQYGICFHHDFLEDLGARPVVYLNESAEEEIPQLIFNSPHLVEVTAKGYDMRWENEWRIKRELRFSTDDVAFLIVPDSDFESMLEWIEAELQDDGSFLDDYIVLPASVFSDPLDYLYMIPKLRHQAWSQVPLFGEWKVDFDDFPPPTAADRSSMQRRAADALLCLGKAAVHEVYEDRHVRRFLSFASGITDETLDRLLTGRLEEVTKNGGEPRASVRDLVIAAYTTLFEIQRDRGGLSWLPT